MEWLSISQQHLGVTHAQDIPPTNQQFRFSCWIPGSPTLCPFQVQLCYFNANSGQSSRLSAETSPRNLEMLNLVALGLRSTKYCLNKKPSGWLWNILKFENHLFRGKHTIIGKNYKLLLCSFGTNQCLSQRKMPMVLFNNLYFYSLKLIVLFLFWLVSSFLIKVLCGNTVDERARIPTPQTRCL